MLLSSKKKGINCHNAAETDALQAFCQFQCLLRCLFVDGGVGLAHCKHNSYRTCTVSVTNITKDQCLQYQQPCNSAQYIQENMQVLSWQVKPMGLISHSCTARECEITLRRKTSFRAEAVSLMACSALSASCWVRALANSCSALAFAPAILHAHCSLPDAKSAS